MKKLYSILLTVAMIFSLAIPTMAVYEPTATNDAIFTVLSDLPNSMVTAPIVTSDVIADSTQINQQITEKGGVPGQLNVLLNDKCVKFPDAVPEIVNGRTMVPIRAIMESLGAEVKDLGNRNISIKRGDVTMQLQIGGDKLTTTGKDGKAVVTTMDSKPYIKADRTYVPVRFLSEACGFDVFWDNDYRTAVVIDQKSIVADMDQDFTIINKLLKAQLAVTPSKMEGNTQFTAKVDVLKPSKTTYSIPGTIKTYTSGTSTMRMDMSIDGSNLLPLIDQLVKDASKDLDQNAPELKMIQDLKPLVKDFKCSLLVTEEGGYYFYMPLMNYFLKAEGSMPTVNDKTWIKMMDMPDMKELMNNPSMGSVLYSSLMSSMDMMEGAMSSFYTYDMLRASGKSCVAMLGDKTFTQKGLTYQWDLKLDQLLKDMWADTGASQADLDEMNAEMSKIIKNATFSMTFGLDASYTMKGDFKFMTDDTGTQAIEINLNSTGDMKKSSTSLLVKATDMFNFGLEGSSTYKIPTTLPDMTLPADSNVFDLMHALTGV
ncbi:MAG: copper amine oxidase N-terminal domain-containing protein [Evtepia sp.]